MIFTTPERCHSICKSRFKYIFQGNRHGDLQVNGDRFTLYYMVQQKSEALIILQPGKEIQRP
uniref:Uncharacterized protein n=1 Tax=Setaria italica TaxID=4555 RepID=K3ZBM9_SETIT